MGSLGLAKGTSGPFASAKWSSRSHGFTPTRIGVGRFIQARVGLLVLAEGSSGSFTLT